MAICLEKGQRINLEKADGEQLRQFCVGANWGAILTRSFFGRKLVRKVDLDLSCILLNAEGKLVDHIYSPLYKREILKRMGLPLGKLKSLDGALSHCGDDLQGDIDGDDGLDNEIIVVDLREVNPLVSQIFFFLNSVGKEDFSQIPHAGIRMYEGTPSKVRAVFATYNVANDARYAGMRAMILGKLYRHGGGWKFAAIGDVFADESLGETIRRIVRDYAR